MSSFFIAESNNRFEMYEYNFPRWIDISKSAKNDKTIVLSGVAFVTTVISAVVCFDYLPEWVKGLTLIHEILILVFFATRILSEDVIYVSGKNLTPEKILADKSFYFVRTCGRLTDGIKLYNVCYVQWEDGKGIAISDFSPRLYESRHIVPRQIVDSAQESTLLIKDNAVKRILPVDLVDPDRILEIVKELGVVDNITAGPVAKEKTGKKILEKISKEC